MSNLYLILGDQLSPHLASLTQCNPAEDIILMCEVWDETTYVKHHKKKIALLFAAMRHFSQELIQRGYQVVYTKLDDPKNTGSFRGEVARVLAHHPIERIRVTHPGEYRVLADIQQWSTHFKLAVDILEDQRFLCSIEQFKHWAMGKKQLTMEFFYREMRKQYDILMTDSQPLGGKWNYDSDNRKPLKTAQPFPQPFFVEPDSITNEVLQLVAQKFTDHFGELKPFSLAVTRQQALAALKKFIAQRLINFGDYQDAMLEKEPWLYHSHLSFYLNCGLLLPLECVHAAEQAYHKGLAPINAVEGFIRQIIGWREYMRGIYWLKMPDYAQLNFFNAQNNLPEFYWSGNTTMNCLHQCVLETQRNAYAHHIQRLMVLGNFALLTGIEPKQVNEWFLIVYADAYEWVELPNVSGMILFADGGYLASKPYAAGGSYINKMSNYCKSCRYKVSKKNGDDACPFNYLYWDFLARHRDKLHSNHRLAMMYKTYDKMSEEKKHMIHHDSKTFLANLS